MSPRMPNFFLVMSIVAVSLGKENAVGVNHKIRTSDAVILLRLVIKVTFVAL